MTQFALIKNGIVDNILVVEKEILAQGIFGDPSSFVDVTNKAVVIGSSYDFNTKIFKLPEHYLDMTLIKITMAQLGFLSAVNECIAEIPIEAPARILWETSFRMKIESVFWDFVIEKNVITREDIALIYSQAESALLIL